MSHLRYISTRLAVLAGALLVCLIVTEVVLRMLGVYYPRTIEEDPVLGFLHRPGMKFWFRDEGGSYVEYNSVGFRDGEWSVDKPAGEFRIAVLGDSYVEALQVSCDDRLTEVLARDLKQQPMFAGKSLRVMNFGMTGYGTGQELLVLRDRVAKYHPDLVVLAFLTGNDFRDNCRNLKEHAHRPFFILDDRENLVLDDSYLAWVKAERTPLKRAIYKIADWSRIVQLLYRVRKNLQSQAEVARVRARGDDQPREAGLDVQMYDEPKTDAWREAWNITEHLLLAVADETNKLGAKLLVVTLSNGDQVHPDPAERAKITKQLGVEDLFYPDRRIAAFCESHKIPVLTLAPTFLAYAEANHAYLHGFPSTNLGGGHWNEQGHKLAGELIAQRIVELETSGVTSAAATVGSP